MTMNYYDILSIKRDATLEEIQKAYKEKSFQFHPDFNKGISDDSMFRIIKEAYETLSDTEKRNQYDASLNKTDQAPSENNNRNNDMFIKDHLKHTEGDLVKHYTILNEVNSKKAEPDKPSKLAFLKNKEWIILYILFLIIYLYDISKEKPQSIGHYIFLISTPIGYTLVSFFISSLAVVFKLIFRQKTSLKEFAYISIIVLLLGLLGNIFQ